MVCKGGGSLYILTALMGRRRVSVCYTRGMISLGLSQARKNKSCPWLVFLSYQLLYLHCDSTLGSTVNPINMPEERSPFLRWITICCHISALLLRLLSWQCLLCEDPAQDFGRQADNACSGLRCRNSKWEEQKEKGGKPVFNLFWPFHPFHIAQKVSAVDDQQWVIASQVEVITSSMMEFLKAWPFEQSCPGSSGEGSFHKSRIL